MGILVAVTVVSVLLAVFLYVFSENEHSESMRVPGIPTGRGPKNPFKEGAMPSKEEVMEFVDAIEVKESLLSLG